MRTGLVIRAWWRRLFPDKGDFTAYAIVLTACVCGLLAAPWWAGILLPGSLLTVLTWPRWRELAAKAAKIDAEHRELGMLELRRGMGWGLGHFVRARLLLNGTHPQIWPGLVLRRRGLRVRHRLRSMATARSANSCCSRETLCLSTLFARR